MMNRSRGLRYIPKPCGEWNINNSYEHLCIVTNKGDSYISKISVPVGIELTNEKYWLCTGSFNAQIEHYRQEVNKLRHIADLAIDLSKKQGLQIANVIDFGADAEGVNDSTLAIQKAIDSVAKTITETWEQPSSGGIVYFPAGRYAISDTIILRNCVTLIGAGRLSTRIFQLENTNKDLIKTENYDSLVGSGLEWVDDGTHNVVVPTDFAIKDMLIYGNQWGNSRGNGICIYGYNYNIDNVLIFGCAESGIICRRETGNGQYGRNENKMIESQINNLQIMLCKNKGMEYYGATDARIDKLYIAQCGNCGLFLNSAIDLGHVHIYDCCTETSDTNDVVGHYGAWISGTNKFDNLIVESCRFGGMYLDGYFTTISKLQLYGNGKELDSDINYPHLMVNNAYYSIIESCNINMMTNYISGIIVSGDNFTMNNVVIAGNIATNYNDRYAIRNDGNYNTFDNVKIYNYRGGCGILLSGTSQAKFCKINALCVDVGTCFSIGAGSSGFNDVNVKYEISSTQTSCSVPTGAIKSSDVFRIRGNFGGNYYKDYDTSLQ